ncbi:MAG: helix-turn-helix transcriptional regulator [Candidatus Nanopelagicaceae bacterium]
MRSIARLGAARQLAGFTELRNNTVVKKTEDRTRDLVARAILENGPATAVALAARLKITPAGIRRHLDTLVDQGVLAAREPFQSSLDSRGRGRPSKVFVMTDIGREKFEHTYDDLAVSALRFMSSTGSNSLVKEFAKNRAQEITKRAAQILANKKNLSEKSEALANFLTEEGFAANNHSQGIGEELCQNHCPIAHVAAQFPELCEAETEAFSELLGTHVQRLATIAHGDGVCTTFIPNSTNLNKTGKRA